MADAKRRLRIGLVGAGMFGGDLHLPVYAQLQAYGLAPWLGRIGHDALARELADIEIEFAGLATRTESSALKRQQEFAAQGVHFPVFHGATPWEPLLTQEGGIDLLAVATPDHLHTAPILAAIDHGTHVLTEKPMTLDAAEADQIIARARERGVMVGVDMHKRYDPDHLFLRDTLTSRIGTPLYGRAVLEEPLEISTQVFEQWAAQSDPFSYVGCHWTDLYIAYFGVKPVSLYAVGQKHKLKNEFGIDTFDAVQVKVTFDNGMSIDFINNWIMPEGFEGPVNQESVLYGTDGVVESDSQYRGLRFATTGAGSRTSNTHFTRQVKRPDGSRALVGYGADSIIACVVKVAEMKFLGKSLDELRGTYPTAEEGRISVLMVQAAREVCRRNYAYFSEGRGAPVTAFFSNAGITILDPYAGPEVIYAQPV
jgi:predicted dehydrogenase